MSPSRATTSLTTFPGATLLVMGGDQVYPTADYATYRDRLIGPYRAALPAEGDRPPDLYAIPGNHDWYDGLTSFIRVFCQHKAIGGWRTRQDRSYFAIRLPQGWWLWGIDTQFDSYLDPGQMHYFRDVVAPMLRKGDSIILCQAEPSWVKASLGEPNAYEHVDFMQREIVEPHGAQVRMAIAGDHHHYARYESADGRQLITSGGGGAYLAGTHHLPSQVQVPPKRATDIDKSEPTTYELAETYPTRKQSKLLRAGVMSLPFRNGSFWAVVGIVYLVQGWSVLLGLRETNQSMESVLRTLQWDDLLNGLYLRPLGFLMTVMLVLGLAAFNGAPGPKRRWGFGISHVLAHQVLGLATVLGLSWALDPLPEGLVCRRSHRRPRRGREPARFVARCGVPAGRRPVQDEHQRTVRSPAHRGVQQLHSHARRSRRSAHPVSGCDRRSRHLAVPTRGLRRGSVVRARRRRTQTAADRTTDSDRTARSADLGDQAAPVPLRRLSRCSSKNSSNRGKMSRATFFPMNGSWWP